MEQTDGAIFSISASSTTTAVRKPIHVRADSSLGQSLDNSNLSPRQPVSLSPSHPSVSTLLKFETTIIHIEEASLAEPTSHQAAIMIAPPKPACESINQETSSNHRDVAPQNNGRDSACILTPYAKTSESDSALALPRCPQQPQQHQEQHLKMIAKEDIPENELSRILEHPNPTNEPEYDLAPAGTARPAVHGADTCSTLRPDPKHTSVCPQINQFSRITHPDDDIWVQGSDLGRVLRYPPPDMAGENQRFNEFFGVREATCQGFNTERVNHMVRINWEQTLKEGKYVKDQVIKMNGLHAKAHDNVRASNQLLLSAAILSDRIRSNPGTEAARSSQRALDSLGRKKLRIDQEAMDIDRELRAEKSSAVESIEADLLADFDPAVGLAARRREEQEAEIQLAQEDWMREWTTPWRVKGDARRPKDFRKQSWKWHSEDDESSSDRTRMSTFPTSRYTSKQDLDPPKAFPPQVVEALKVPPWFAVFESKDCVKGLLSELGCLEGEMGGLQGKTEEARFKEVMSMLGVLGDGKASRETQTSPEKLFEKQWHEPKQGWPYPVWEKSGGWWVCRSGPSASRAEQMCRQCHPKPNPRPASTAQSRNNQCGSRQPGPSRQPAGAPASPANSDPAEPAGVPKPRVSRINLYKKLMAEIEKAMAQCNRQEVMSLEARMELHRQIQEEIDRQREREERDRNQHHASIAVYFIGPESPERFKLIDSDHLQYP